MTTANELVDPLTGEVHNLDDMDVDTILGIYEDSEKLADSLYAMMVRIRMELSRRSPRVDKNTVRIAGRKRKAVLSYPSKSWSDSKLKEAWNAFPQFRDEFLKISKISVIAREVTKLSGTTIEDNPPLATFQKMLASAVCDSKSPPSIKIEQ